MFNKALWITSFCALIFPLLVSFSTEKANAALCFGGVHNGFGVFMKTEHECETESLSNQNCYKAKINNNPRYWYSGTQCIINDSNAYYGQRKTDYDFKVKSFKIKPKKEKDGVNCFSALSTNRQSSKTYYFCDYARTEPFDKVAVEMLFKNRSEFASSLASLGHTTPPKASSSSTQSGQTSANNLLASPAGKFISLTDYSFFTSSNESYAEAKKLIANRQPMSAQFFNQLTGTPASKYLSSRRKNKAMVGAFPLTCNYRYTSWNKSSLREAYNQAKKGCEKKINDRNRTLGQNCKCRIVALNDVLFYQPEIYIGERGDVPILARVVEGAQQIEIKGKVKIANRGSTKSAFIVETNTGVKACEGNFDISDKAVGKCSMNCFEGKYVGTGDFVTTSFNPELQVANGTAEFTATNGAKMFVIFGEDAE